MCGRGAGVGAGGGGGGVLGLQGCKVGGCKVASLTTDKVCFCTCFVVVYYWGNRLFLYLCGLVPFRGWWRRCGGGAGVGVLVGVVVPVVVRGWQAIPPFDGLGLGR